MQRLVVDGVCFQAGDALACAFWEGVLAGLAHEFDVVLLDRGNAPAIEGTQRWPFPSWSGRETAADSALLEEVCQALEAAFFLSTTWTTPLQTPSVAVVQALPSQMTDAAPPWQKRRWLEEEAAILYARRRICVAADGAAKLVLAFPRLNARRASTVEQGVDPACFRPKTRDAFATLAKSLGLSRDFIVVVEDPFAPPAQRLGSPRASKGKALQWVAIDGSRIRAGDVDVRVPFLDELACLLSAAVAIAIAPTLHAFPLWVDAAQKCGSPALLHATVSQPGRLGETAMVLEEGWSVDAIMRAAGVAKARSGDGSAFAALPYAPDQLASHIAIALRQVREEVDRGTHSQFYRDWARLRQIQARVDY